MHFELILKLSRISFFEFLIDFEITSKKQRMSKGMVSMKEAFSLEDFVESMLLARVSKLSWMSFLYTR